MNPDENKLDPELQRWMNTSPIDQRTVVVRVAYSQDPDEAADSLTTLGMSVSSSGKGVIVAASSSESIEQASHMPWISRIDFPQQLHMKSRLPRTEL